MKVCGADATAVEDVPLEERGAGADDEVSAVAPGAVRALAVGLVGPAGFVGLVVAVARMSSTVDSWAPQVASTWTSCAVNRADVVPATRSVPVCARSVPSTVVLEVVAVLERSEPGCSQIVSARPTRCAGQSCWLPGRPR